MEGEIKLELLDAKVMKCHGGSYPEEMMFLSSRPITDEDANELERFIRPFVRGRMRGCDMAGTGFDWAIEISVSKLDPTLIRVSITLPCKLNMARLGALALLEAVVEMELARAARVSVFEEALLSQVSPPVD